MSALAEFFAAILLWLSAMALGQFGVALEPTPGKAPPKAERTVARTPRPVIRSAAICPHRQAAAISA